MRGAAAVLLLLIASSPPAAGRDSVLAFRLRAEVRSALREIGLSPSDLVVLDIRAWRMNAVHRRASGQWAGDWPAPRERDPLRPRLVDRALRHPLEALQIGTDLARGYPVAGLPGRVDLTPSRGPRIALPREPVEAPAPVRVMVSRLRRLDEAVRRSLPRNIVEKRLPGWMMGGLEPGDLARAREVFDRLGALPTDGLRLEAVRIARVFARVLQCWTGAAPDWPAGAPIRIETPHGLLIVGTEGPDVYREDAWFIVDPGGDDLYLNNAGGARGPLRTACVLDLGGDDRYLTRAPFSQGAAEFGVGMLIDLAGDDTYLGREFCQGAALVGVGLVLDGGGRDRFVADRFAQAAAAFGHGLLIAEGAEGDTYHLEQFGQGFARTAGYGILEDHGGNDRYTAGTKYPSEMYSQWTGGRTVHWSFVQGSAYGFYCRYFEPDGDGGRKLVTREMFPGGVGLLLDHDGHDVYDGSMYAQGTAYFYGVGILVDRAGNDRYRATWYGQGAAAHYAAGILVDAAGDDVYEGMHQVQGNGRDFSTAVFVDLAGDDRYHGEDRVQGCGDLADGYGIFIDAAGNDVYDATRKTARGFATERRPERQPRPDRPYHDVGVFLDLGGLDFYRGAARGENGAVWIQKATGRGVGVDR